MALLVTPPSERHHTLLSREEVMEVQFRHAELAASPVQLAREEYMTGETAKYPPSQQYSSGNPKMACAVSCAAVLKLVGSVVALPLAGFAQSRSVFV